MSWQNIAELSIPKYIANSQMCISEFWIQFFTQSLSPPVSCYKWQGLYFDFKEIDYIV